MTRYNDRVVISPGYDEIHMYDDRAVISPGYDEIQRWSGYIARL